MKSYILQDNDFKDLLLSIKQDMSRGAGKTQAQKDALEEAYRAYNYQVVQWIQRQGVRVSELI